MNPKDYAITTCDDPIHCPKPWTLVDSGYIMHEMGMGKNWRQPDNCRTQDPLRQVELPNPQNVSISRDIDPYPPIHLAGGVGWQDEKTLHFQAFLALRQLQVLAEWGDRGWQSGKEPPAIRVCSAFHPWP